jgi:hypothetical protein
MYPVIAVFLGTNVFSEEMIPPAQKAILVKKLAVHLGFHDGADDVLEHLLNIESKEVIARFLCVLTKV